MAQLKTCATVAVATNTHGNHWNGIVVHKRQKGNPVLHCIKSVYRFYVQSTVDKNETFVADYEMSFNICALYLGIRYHKMKPDYVHRRISDLRTQKRYKCRVLLLHMDDGDNRNDDLVVQLNKICCINKLTLILAWTHVECARYIDSYHFYRNTSPDCLMSSSYKQFLNRRKHRQGTESSEREQRENMKDNVIDTLSQVKSMSTTNAATVMENFGSIAALSACAKQQLVALPGFGNKKAKYLFNAFNKPFKAAR